MSPTINPTEFTSAMKTLKRAKNFFSLLIILALLVQAAGFIVLYFCGSEIHAVEIIHYQQSPQNMHMGVQARHWYDVFIWAFPVAKLVALFSSGMLMLTLMFTSVLVLTGGGSGIMYFVSAFLWALFVMLLVSPWQDIIRGGLFSGALYNLDELQAWLQRVKPLASGEVQLDFFEWVRFFARFLGYPLVSLFVLILMLTRYARGYKQCMEATRKEKLVASAPQI